MYTTEVRRTSANSWGVCGNGTSGLGCGPQVSPTYSRLSAVLYRTLPSGDLPQLRGCADRVEPEAAARHRQPPRHHDPGPAGRSHSTRRPQSGGKGTRLKEPELPDSADVCRCACRPPPTPRTRGCLSGASRTAWPTRPTAPPQSAPASQPAKPRQSHTFHTVVKFVKNPILNHQMSGLIVEKPVDY